MGKLNAKTAGSCKIAPGKSEQYLQAGDNLVMRLRRTSSGETAKAWQFKYRAGERRVTIHIGTYPEITFAGARDIAAGYRAQLARGEDPKSVLEREQSEVKAQQLAVAQGEIPETFRQLFDRWKQDYLAHNHDDGGAHIQGMFERHVLDQLGELRLEHIKQIHIATLLDKMREKGLTRSCGIVLDSTRQMLKFAMPFDWIQRDFTMGLRKNVWNGDGEARTRVLTDAEIKALYKQLRSSDLNPRWKHALWFILACGTRAEETLLARRADIDIDAREWFIPVDNQKKLNTSVQLVHVVHLSEFAVTHLRALLDMPGTDIFVFPARLRSDAPVARPADSKTLTKAVRDRQRGVQLVGKTANTTELQLAGGGWDVHDLRRTMSTVMQELGVESDVIDKCQNHVQPNPIRRTYQRSPLTAPMAEAWDALGAHLARLCADAEQEWRKEHREEYLKALRAATGKATRKSPARRQPVTNFDDAGDI